MKSLCCVAVGLLYLKEAKQKFHGHLLAQCELIILDFAGEWDIVIKKERKYLFPLILAQNNCVEFLHEALSQKGRKSVNSLTTTKRQMAGCNTTWLVYFDA